MRLFIPVIIIIIVFFGFIYILTRGSERPSGAVIEQGLLHNLNFEPMKWDYKMGKETKASNGKPAWPVVYHITTSEKGTEKEIITLKLLFYQEGIIWKTEKVE